MFPNKFKLDHLVELTLANFAFVSLRKAHLFHGPSQMITKVAPMPRLKHLRLIHCTSDDGALLPLAHQASQSLTVLTIIQTTVQYACSDGVGDRWHAQTEVFGNLKPQLKHFTLGVEHFRRSYDFGRSALTSLHLTANKFQSAAMTELPPTLRHLSITITDNNPSWSRFGNEGQSNVMDDLSRVLVDRYQMKKLRLITLRFMSSLTRSVKFWIMLSRFQKLCKRRRTLLKLRMDAKKNAWGVPIGRYGRMKTIAEAEDTDILPPPSDTRRGLRKAFSVATLRHGHSISDSGGTKTWTR